MYSYVMCATYDMYYPGLSNSTFETGFYNYSCMRLFKDSHFLAIL